LTGNNSWDRDARAFRERKKSSERRRERREEKRRRVRGAASPRMDISGTSGATREKNAERSGRPGLRVALRRS
jgi:hypothetical protein